MKKEIIIGALLLILGFVIGILCRPNHFRDTVDMVKDTLVIYDTARYSKLELASKSYRLNVPKIESPSLVYIPADSTTIIYRDSIRYVTMPRQYFYTKTDDVEIWYSGVDPQIDSVNVFSRISVVTHTINDVSKNRVVFGVEASYYGNLYCPIYLEYEHDFKPWLSCYFRLGHDMVSRSNGAVAGMKIKIGL